LKRNENEIEAKQQISAIKQTGTKKNEKSKQNTAN
jgi:hypothetical protein